MKLEQDEQEITDLITSRLSVGRKEYGILPVMDPKRDWSDEALEEALDLSVYLAAEILRKKRIERVSKSVRGNVLQAISDLWFAARNFDRIASGEISATDFTARTGVGMRISMALESLRDAQKSLDEDGVVDD